MKPLHDPARHPKRCVLHSSPLRHPNRAGFTLAEVLVAVLIMGGILVSVTQILHVARISRDNIHNIQETQLAGPAIMDMIERDLRGLIVYNRAKRDHFLVENHVLRGADGDSIDFVTTTDNLVLRINGDNFERSTFNEVGYHLRPNPGYDDFLELYRREDQGIDDEPFEGGEFTFLHDRIKNFDIQVFAEDGVDADAFEDWGDEDARGEEENIGVPARVEITMTLELQRRVEREALRPSFLTEMTYRRIIRLPEVLRVEETALLVPMIPSGSSSSGDQGAGANAKSSTQSTTTLTGGAGGRGAGGSRGGVKGGKGSGDGERP
ncbi:MAG: prepilin-type N-terminal cleavage/methylation domain-containing protein [bacterium]